MRAAAVFLALVASVSAGHILRRQYPDCANPCIANAQIGSCFSDDLNCLCKSPDFISSTTSCIIASCSADDALKAEAVARGFCETVGVTITSVDTSQPTSTPNSSATPPTSPSSAPSNPPSSAPSNPPSSAPSASSPPPSPTPSSTPPAPAPSQPNNAVSNGVNAALALGALGVGAFIL